MEKGNLPKQKNQFIFFKYFFIAFLLFTICSKKIFAQNDNCTNAVAIAIPNNGFGLGVFNSTSSTLSNATVETGESFAPAILVAGQNQKSIWYKFTLPTTRSVRVSLAQTGSAITAGDAGFAVYKTNSCLPTVAQISSKLTPIGVFGSTFHPCVEAGDYLVQVSSKAAANGPVYIIVEIAATIAAYDKQLQAYQFPALSSPNFTRYIDYEVDCQSVEIGEVCSIISNSSKYNKSSWHTFTTPAYFDYVAVLLASPTGYFTNSTTLEKFGYNLYQGNAVTQTLASLNLINGCDSILTNGYDFGKKIYRCQDLLPNTTYSVQLFFNETFNNDVRIGLTYEGFAPTQAPEPILANLPLSNKLGILPASANGITTTVSDQLACNARHSLHPCNPSLPDSGFKYNNLKYNLSTFFTFTLATTSRLNINAAISSPPYNPFYNSVFLMRLYNTSVTNNCTSLDTANLVTPPFFSNANLSLDCLPAGNYTLQVMGRDTINNYQYYSNNYINIPNYVYGLLFDYGRKFNLNINVQKRNASNRYDLRTPGAFDTTNLVAGVMQPMVAGVTYQSRTDTLGCANTVLPHDTTCLPTNSKAIYREMNMPDSGVVYITNNYLWGKLYKGDANALSISQNVHNYPERITGLLPVSNCIAYTGECNGNKVCVLPGTYTHVSFANSTNIGQTNQTSYKFSPSNTIHNSPANSENMGILNPSVNTLTSSFDYFSCKDNAIPINGYIPCTISGDTATKAIYREFYLSAPATVDIGCLDECYNYYYNTGGVNTLFSGKASSGIAGLTVLPAPYRCFTSLSTNNTCNTLDVGWYSIVTYGSGPTYANPFQNLNQKGYSSYVGYQSQVRITATLACPKPKYNRPYKAAIDTITNLPFLIQWANRAGHTAAINKTDTTFLLYKENFNCTVDTPFATHPIPSCNAASTKVAYYVFRTTQESYVQINTKNFYASVYQGNARTDSALFGAATLIQNCVNNQGYIQICRLQPGTYTLAVFATNTDNCVSIIPEIYIDRVGYSRFDHANNAYDFGVIPPDSTYYSGKVGDVNPLDANRVPSNDFFYCTTGSRQSDPIETACNATYNSQIYNTTVNNDLYNGTTNATQNPFIIPRRNLWYSFLIDKGGYVKVKVRNRTIGKGYQYPFSVYKSNVNGNLPFSTVVSSGQVDSTLAQGLTFVTQNNSYYYCSNGPNEITFYRDPCNNTAERYYILVDNTNSYPYEYPSMKPNSQLDVSILFDSVNAIQPLFDHYSQANSIGTNLGAGTYNGATDNFSCATRDAPDPLVNYICNKTLWYKFTTNVTGYVRFRSLINNVSQFNNFYIQVFRQNIPGDSTVNGLQFLNTANNSFYDPATSTTWGQVCVSPGTYYIILPGCNQLNEYAYPQIKIIEQAGDFCSAAVNATLSGAGNNVSSLIIDCHTIGTDYGEFNPTLTCPAGAITTNYKTSWFKINITGTDTLDVTTFLTENTNASPSDIKYRLMNGNCGAMQERSCVQDAQTQDTYKCLAPGNYFIQVFTPITKNGVQVTGTIDLHLSAIVHADTCAPLPPCLANANFIPQFDCALNEKVTFINYSTFGSSVNYLWNFGYNGQTSIAVSPQFNYPALATAQTYTVSLTMQNTTCAVGGSATYTLPITIPGRPNFNLGNDTTLCTVNSSILLNATTWPNATYLWQNGSTNPTYNATSSGTYSVKVTYNGCVKRDTIQVKINTIVKYLQIKYLCGNDSVLLNSARGLGETYLWNNGSTNPSLYASMPGIYVNTINWNGCIIKDTFKVLVAQQPFGNNDTTKCFPFSNFLLNATVPGATNYVWHNNSTASTFNVTAPGLYWVRIFNGNCYVYDTVNVIAGAAPINTTLAATVCSGQSYTLPWGVSVNLAGSYKDTLRSLAGCDSVRRTVNLIIQSVQTLTTNPIICQGQNYTLPWGVIVNAAGVYRDTLRNIQNCDSIRRIVNLSYQQAVDSVFNNTVCAGYSYILPWGATVNLTGIYRDTIKTLFGCDSIRKTINLTVENFTTTTANANICGGQNYTLPWGAIVNINGIYRDTLRYTTGCDSVRRILNLTVQNFTTTTTNANICAGQNFTLPWGTIVNATGVYRDTLHYTTGCDSVRRTINLTVQNFITNTANTNICAGQNYTLPWGTIVNVAGIYRDTLHYTTGCDSVRRVVNLTVQNFTTTTAYATICAGQNYTLPWGAIVNTSGIYRDTLHYTTGCDSLRRIVNLTVQNFITTTANANICAGGNYTLPWGAIVNINGIYRDTLRYTTSCDSVRRIINLTVQNFTTTTANANICTGQNYTLPWGTVVSAAGIYRDTLRYSTGCDSVRRIINLTVQDFTTTNNNASICTGQNYTLPWGTIVNTSGIYRDTLRYSTGCDSLRRIVNLTVQNFTTTTTNANICAGQNYTLPWGTIVNATGVYRDTLHYTTGCDSVRRVVNLSIQNFTTTTTNVNICAGQNYTLPWGMIVNSAGIYKDTLRYSTGCDSVRRIVNLSIQNFSIITTNPVICAGLVYTLPWGMLANTTGTYKDTLRYTTGCDSVRKIVNLSIIPALTKNINAVICANEKYILPSGIAVSVAGLYIDTLKATSGCDSLIRNVALIVKDLPNTSISKSNDVSCALGISKLSITGGKSYLWSPTQSLNNATVNNPIASPNVTTLYKVTTTANNGCTKTDSIVVIFKTETDKYQVPTAFTPNGDGLNDCFGVSYWGSVSDFKFTIFNRYGETVFSTNNNATCWDGTYKGFAQNTGVFVYQISANSICGSVIKKGTITLIR